MKKLKGNKRKDFLKEVSYNISGAGTKEATREEIDLGLTSSEPPKRPLAAAAAAAAMRVESPADKVAKELKISKIKALGIIRDLVTKEGISEKKAADQIIKQHIEKAKTRENPVPQANLRGAKTAFQKPAQQLQPTDKLAQRIKEIAQIKQEANIPKEVLNPFEEFIDKLEKGDYGAFYLHVVADLNYPRILPEFDNQIKNLVAERTKLIQDNNLFIDPKTGEPLTVDNSKDNVIREFYNLQKQIYEKDNEKTNAIVSKIDSTKLKNLELYKKIIAGDAGALNTFIENLKNAAKPEKRNMNNRSLYAIEGLKAKGIATEKQVTDFREYLKSNDLLERKKHIKLAKILF
jgi:hypothetical protein